MIAMFYGAELPDDFDMRRIVERVALKGPEFDRYPGVLLKAFVARDRRRADASPDARNFYGAFYVWRSQAAAQAYLAGDFANFVKAFGRPPVETWPIVEFAAPARVPASLATLTPLTLPQAHWQRAAQRVRAILEGGAADTARVGGVVALDPARQRGVRLDLWASPPPPDAEGTRFDVLYVSRSAMVPA